LVGGAANENRRLVAEIAKGCRAGVRDQNSSALLAQNGSNKVLSLNICERNMVFAIESRLNSWNLGWGPLKEATDIPEAN
jgi:hypothetical protein